MCDDLRWRKEPTGSGLWWRRLVKYPNITSLHEVYTDDPARPGQPLLRMVFLTGRGEYWDYRPGMKEAVDPRYEWAGPVTKPKNWMPGDPPAL